ncbi:hypothetical protein HBZS_101650 [Helicobacter bizzozeronii CCUG 35545]|nr:hypothetical protein HBZS_101650 [Helicobacter bizzozeronii CCUG 35545]
MATRSQVREAVVGLLYAFDSGNGAILNLAPSLLEERKIKKRPATLCTRTLRGHANTPRKLG